MEETILFYRFTNFPNEIVSKKELIIADSEKRRNWIIDASIGYFPAVPRFTARVKTRNDRVQPVTSGGATGFPFESIRFFVHRISARNSDFSRVGERDRA